jgi:RNA-directed DNA polymerase
MEEGYHGTNINNLDKLSSVLCIPKNELVYFANNLDKHVHRITKPKKNGKSRDILAPSKQVTAILQRIKIVFFDDYTYPHYVFGLGGNSLKDHASVHATENELIQADLRDFFPSIHYKLVYSMWINDFALPTEVARILTKLTTFNAHLQQGFATSSHIAAVIAGPLTYGLHAYCKGNGIAFSQYVDDLNFSGTHINKQALFKVLIDLARKHGFSVKKQKTGVFSANIGKTITGVSVYRRRTRAPKRIRQRAIIALIALSEHPKNEQAQKRVKGYFGHLNHLSKQDGKSYKRKIKSIYKS